MGELSYKSVVMEQVGKYFTEKRESYRLFFDELRKLVDSVRRDCEQSIDQQYNRVAAQYARSDPLFAPHLKTMQSQRHLHFHSIVNLLVRALQQLPHRLPISSSPQKLENIPVIPVIIKSLEETPPPAQQLSPIQIKPTPVTINYNTTPVNNVNTVNTTKPQIEKPAELSNASESDQKVPYILSASKSSSDRLNTSLRPKTQLKESQSDKYPRSYQLSKMSPLVFELSKGTTEYAKQEELGISEGNGNSMMKVVQLLDSSKLQEEKVTYKICQQLDKRIYDQANQYLNSCMNKKYNRYSSPKKNSRQIAGSPIAILRDTRQLDNKETQVEWRQFEQVQEMESSMEGKQSSKHSRK